MKLIGLSTSFPDNLITNRDLIHKIETHSKETKKNELSKILELTEVYLEKTDSHQRFWIPDAVIFHRLLKASIDKALCEADIAPGEIDLVIQAGISNTFEEPGDAHFCADLGGMHRAKCFDITDACNSFTTAAMTAQELLRSGKFRNVVIVSYEFLMVPGGVAYPSAFNVQSLDQVAWKFPIQTLADAVSVSVFKGEGEDWHFESESRPEFAGLCFIPSEMASPFLRGSQSFPGGIETNPGEAISFGSLLVENGAELCMDVYRKAVSLKGEPKIVLPHTSGKRMWEKVAREVGCFDKCYFVYRKVGNVAAASFPVGYQDARENGLIQLGDQVGAWIAAAGLSLYCTLFESALEGSKPKKEDEAA